MQKRRILYFILTITSSGDGDGKKCHCKWIIVVTTATTISTHLHSTTVLERSSISFTQQTGYAAPLNPSVIRDPQTSLALHELIPQTSVEFHGPATGRGV